MHRLQQLHRYRKHLEDRYAELIQRSNDYRFEDETTSDRAAFKAMKILEKINQVNYLDRDYSVTTP